MKRFIQIVALLCTLVVGAAALAVIVSQTAWFKDWLRGFIVRQADDYLNGHLSISRLDGNLFFGVELENVRVTVDGEPVISVKDIGLDYSVFDFLSRGIVLDDIRLNGPVIHVERTADGWNFGRLLKEQRKEADREGPGRPVSIGEIGITDGTFVVSGPVGTAGMDVPDRIDGFNARIGFQYEPVRYSIDIGHVSFRASRPGLELHDLSGRISVRDDTLYLDDVAVRTKESALELDGAVESYTQTPVLELTASSDKIALAEFARVIPALAGYTLQPAFEVKASGPLDRLQVHVNARSTAGSIEGDLITDVTGPERTFEGEMAVRRLDLAPLLRDRTQRSDITANATFDLRMSEVRGRDALGGLTGTWRITAPHVALMGYAARDVKARGRFERGVVHVDGSAVAYGGRATVRGFVNPSAPLRMELRGDVAHLDLRNLPETLKAPRVPGDINAAYEIRGSFGTRRDMVAAVTFRPSALAGASILDGSTATVRMVGADIQYAADVQVRDLDLQKIGRGLGVDALAEDRYETDLNGHIAAEGSGTTLEVMTLTARGRLTDSSLFGGQVPALTFDARVGDRTATVRAAGQFAGFDPAALSGRADLKGEVAGALDVNATVRELGSPIGPDSVSARGRVEVGPSRVGEIVVDHAAVEGAYENRHGDITRLQVAGPAVSLEARGPIDLRADGGSTNVEYRADLKSLETLAKLADKAMSGSAVTEGRVTGNGRALGIQGNLSASNIQYGNTSVLSAKTDYSVELPELSFSRAQVSVNGGATLLQVAGRELTQADVEATWQQQSVRFKTTVSDQRRTVSAAGNVVLHPDHSEVHLGSFAVQTEGVEWRTAPGAEAAIRYGTNRLEVDDLRLVSGTQQIAASGAWGGPSDTLRVEARDVQLAALDQLALGEQRFGGTLSATATLGGTREAPKVDASFQVTGGSFRQYKYASLEGKVDYGPTGVRLDTRLTQNPDAWITAKGFVPVAFFRPAAGAPSGEHHEARPGEALDVEVKSSALDLGIVQGFVPQLSAVSGTLQADVRAVGSAGDPHLVGSIDIRNGAFTVAELTEGGYTGLDTRIALQQDRVLIESFRILDEHQNWLQVDGEIAVHQRQIGSIEIAVKSTEFEIIDNQLADVKVNTDLKISGELRRPRVAGEIAVHTGTVHVDKILEQTTSDAYALTPTPLETSPQSAVAPAGGATAVAATGRKPAPATAPAEPTGSAFDGLALDVALTIPNNMVVKGSGLNPSGSSPVSLGDVNVTIGGDITARKAAGQPDVRLVGTVNTVRGNYDFQGRRFEIQRDGRIQFVGTTPIDPRLELTARRVIAGIEVFVRVRGTARAPELELSSRPGLDEADILSLIVFNQPVNSLGEGQQISLAQRAGALATGFVASSLAESIGGATELDVFELQTTAENGGGGSLTIGEQVGERLFVKFRQAFGAQSISELILEYQLAEFLRLQTSVAEGNSATQRTLMRRVEQSGVDLIFFFSY
jgi:autotransporter translocation and assembly factor TamB